MARTGDGPRSGGVPTDRGVTAISSVISQRVRPIVIKRPTTETGPLDETTETLSEHTESLWPVSPSERIEITDTGDRLQGDLRALALDGIDVQTNDRITYGGVEYEVNSVIGQPEDAQADGTDHDAVEYFDISLVRYE